MSGKPRCLQSNGNNITWTQFEDAYLWDQSNFSLPVHERLSEQHFELDSAAKMRNLLAEDALDRKMLFLMEVCEVIPPSSMGVLISAIKPHLHSFVSDLTSIVMLN